MVMAAPRREEKSGQRNTGVLTTMTRIKFDAAARERFLALLGAGRTIEEACATVGISRATVSKWRARGRRPGADDEAAAFAVAFDAIREGRGEQRLTADDALRLLEQSARKGSVQAQRALLAELRRREGAAAWVKPSSQAGADPFDELERDELERRHRVREEATRSRIEELERDELERRRRERERAQRNGGAR
jgi:transposase